MKILEDSTLAVQAAEDPEAFSMLFDRLYKPVCNYIRYRCDDDLTADELTAQVFERLLKHLHRYAPEKGAFAPWLFTIARNTVNDHWRRARRLRWISLDLVRDAVSSTPSPETTFIQHEETEQLLTALQQLPARDRDILGLKFAGGLTNRDIARTTGLSESHVGVIIYRAIGRLRTILGETE